MKNADRISPVKEINSAVPQTFTMSREIRGLARKRRSTSLRTKYFPRHPIIRGLWKGTKEAKRKIGCFGESDRSASVYDLSRLRSTRTRDRTLIPVSGKTRFSRGSGISHGCIEMQDCAECMWLQRHVTLAKVDLRARARMRLIEQLRPGSVFVRYTCSQGSDTNARDRIRVELAETIYTAIKDNCDLDRFAF